ncbi:hypothetical protein SFRURICE_019986 [Spodoptera frugiperda]|nr:hypothetical protein SFRURICE_019986 [Spodoptera frugiperda]
MSQFNFVGNEGKSLNTVEVSMLDSHHASIGEQLLRVVVDEFYTAIRLSKVQKSFMGFCVKCYNKLPTTILNLNGKKFKSCIKRELCKQAYYKLSDYIEDKNVWQHKHYFKIETFIKERFFQETTRDLDNLDGFQVARALETEDCIYS